MDLEQIYQKMVEIEVGQSALITEVNGLTKAVDKFQADTEKEIKVLRARTHQIISDMHALALSMPKPDCEAHKERDEKLDKRVSALENIRTWILGWSAGIVGLSTLTIACVHLWKTITR